MNPADPLPLSLHEDMTADEINRFDCQADNASYYADRLMMQAWLLVVARKMEEELADARGLSLSFDEETPNLMATARLHTEQGIITWTYHGGTAVNVAPNIQPDREQIEKYREWLSDRMLLLPNSVRSRSAINDVQSRSDRLTVMDHRGLRDLSMELAFPDPKARADFQAQIAARGLDMGTDPVAAPPSQSLRL